MPKFPTMTLLGFQSGSPIEVSSLQLFWRVWHRQSCCSAPTTSRGYPQSFVARAPHLMIYIQPRCSSGKEPQTKGWKGRNMEPSPVAKEGVFVCACYLGPEIEMCADSTQKRTPFSATQLLLPGVKQLPLHRVHQPKTHAVFCNRAATAPRKTAPAAPRTLRNHIEVYLSAPADCTVVPWSKGTSWCQIRKIETICAPADCNTLCRKARICGQSNILASQLLSGLPHPPRFKTIDLSHSSSHSHATHFPPNPPVIDC